MQQCKGCTQFDDRLGRWKCIKSHTKHFLLFLRDLIALGLAGWHEYRCPYWINKYTRIRESHTAYIGPIYCRRTVLPISPVDTGMLRKTHNLPVKRCGECSRWFPIEGISCQGRCIMTTGFCLKERKVTQCQDSCHREDKEE